MHITVFQIDRRPAIVSYDQANVRVVKVFIVFTIRMTYTRETPALGGISLALRGSGAFGGDKKVENEI